MRRLAIGEIDALEDDAQAIGGAAQAVQHARGEPARFAGAPFGDDQRGAHFEIIRTLERAHVVHGARRRRLHVHLAALQALDAHGEERARLVDDRERLLRRALAGARRNPVDAVLGEELEPRRVAPLVQQPRFAQDEGFQLFPHCAIQAFQVSYWCRTAISLVPGATIDPSGSRRSDSTPRRMSIHSFALLARPRWQRSKISRSSEATSEAGDAARFTNCSVSSCISAGAPSRRKHCTSTTVRSTASGLTTRIAPKRAFSESVGHTRLLNRSTARTSPVFSSPWRATSACR